ncbi:TPA: kinase [Staphylococcus aureus]|uniref:staphylokinase domain-containing protein n=1 Tax=Staphylococcus aureus TaxID=1280 RepID=UPI000DFADB1C|nr:staphylokinase domain-containing protein [Staphylococcus aureus]SUK09023.1 Staphylokinase [Staphylococcus aureus]SUK14366.1 Staphylokinase [Staphylococcus aureus]HDD0210672.1 kinase [Staphylococcus aureus]HDD0306373.1 kinase [Staphylococcus aureus]HDD0322653.1 kinase [Staphylococcus aureus]
MKKIKNVLKVIVMCSVFLPIVFHYEANALSLAERVNLKKGDDASHYEPAGPHLMTNITAFDKTGKLVSMPHYSEYPLKPGTHLTKEKIKMYIEWNLDNHDYGKYKVIDLAPNAKVEVTYDNIDTKQRETKYFDVTDAGFTVPDLSKHIKNPSFNLVTDVIVEEKNQK